MTLFFSIWSLSLFGKGVPLRTLLPTSSGGPSEIPLPNKEASVCVEVSDMEVEVFRTLLHFVYTDTVPELERMGEQATVMAQHLLEAADRYGLERLKRICVEKVSAEIGVDTVATTLALAEQHGCPELKSRCMKFILDAPENLHAAAATEGFKHLEASCPSVLTELLKLMAKRNQ
ncbi:unnamed protein product [Urochloa humidicola]